ncbi:MAG: metallophosphoesterase [Flavobacteriaceae bacterium]
MNKISFFFLAIMVSACATYAPQIRVEENQPAYPIDKKIEKTFYLFGDGGNADMGMSTPALLAFKNFLKANPSQENVALFLGDNIYPTGLVPESHKDRTHAEHKLDVQYESVKEGVDKIYFIPGNHDWYDNGLYSLDIQEKYLRDLSGDEDIFLPKNGCPIESIELTESIQLVIVDTQWYLEDWNHHPLMNAKCKIKSREKFFEEIEGEVKKNQNKTILFAMHHPMFTNGVHGGKFAIAKHLFPTQSNFPLPVLSSLVTQVRTQGGVSKQDRFNEKYNELMTRMAVLVKESERLVLLSGHEHNMQYLEEGPIKQIVSGSTSKESYGELGKNGLFSYGGYGFAVLDVFEDGSSWVRFFGVEGDAEPNVLFEYEVHPPVEDYAHIDFPENYPKTVRESVYDMERTDKSAFFETFWGDRYRESYGTKVEAKVAILDTLYGGLTPVRKGGGHQTISLRLEDKEGRNYNMRALKKSALQYLQKVVLVENDLGDDFENTVTEDLIYDFYTAAHPYGAFAIPKLSDAAEVLHTTPELYYVPKQEALGKYNDEYGDALYMIVERPHGKYEGEEIFDFADKIRSTDELFEKILKSENNILDENAYIRARLFDMLIGDWDRHLDQWRWAEFKRDDGFDVFVPIPRDRDQVFANFDGAFLDVIRSLVGMAKQLTVYDEELKNSEWFNAAGIKMDRALLKNSTYEDWINQARFIQENVTDEIIEEAFMALPEEVRDESIQEIKEKIKGRRGNLVDIAETYYGIFSKFQVVTATNKDDFIIITRKPDGITNIKVYRNIKGEKENLMSDRDYSKEETNEIWVYGLADDDIFEVNGEADDAILIRIIGGHGDDIFDIRSGKKIRVYDWRTQPNKIKTHGGARYRFLDDYDNNNYDIHKQITTQNTLIPSLGYNPDDGFLIGISNTHSKYNFQRNPFTRRHKFRAGYYFATDGFDINYNGEFAKIFRRWNMIVGGRFTSPTYARNFFGFGNESVNNDDDLGMDFNRVRWSILAAEVGLKRNSHFGSTFQFKVRGETVELENSPDRFVSLYPELDIEERKYFLNAEAAYAYRSFDNALNPTRGMLFNLILGTTTNVKESGTFGYFKPRLGLYNAISTNRKLVFRSEVAAHINIGSDFEFYQAAALGGNNGLRAYRDERFIGRTSFLTSGDIRYSFNSFKTGLLPLQIGLFTGYDGGRVWVKGEDSTIWHNSLGGGFWIIGADSIQGTFNLFHGEDGLRFSFGFGLEF